MFLNNYIFPLTKNNGKSDLSRLWKYGNSTFCNLSKLQKVDPLVSSIGNSNSWHFITTKNKELETNSIRELIEELDTVPGVPADKKVVKKLEKEYSEYSSCGKRGSVKPLKEMF